jgi:hypothetical protein
VRHQANRTRRMQHVGGPVYDRHGRSAHNGLTKVRDPPRAVELRKLEFVGGGDHLVDLLAVRLVALALTMWMWRLCCTVGALCVGHLGDRRVQCLLLGGVFLHRGLQRSHLILKGLERLHLHFNCIKAA